MESLLHRLLLAVLVLTTFADSYHLDTSRGSHSDLLPQSRHRSRSAFSAFRDTVIRTIWSIPHTPDPSRQPCHQHEIGPPSTIHRRYAGDVVLRFQIRSSQEASALADAVNTLFLDVWEFTPQWVDVRLSKDVVPSLLGLLPLSLQHAHTPLMHDLAQAVAETYPVAEITEHPPSPRGQRAFSPTLGSTDEADQTNIFFRDYQPLSVITPWMRLLHSLFPTHVRMISVGTSYEGRDIQALRIGVHPTNSQVPSSPRKTIIIAGGSHAREWISTSTVSYVAYSFITAYGRNQEITKLLEGFDWVFIPTLNPDGYVYSWQTDRLWRKNRQETSLRFCKGLDLDRSYGFEWDDKPPQDNPCSESFSGEAPFEGFEARRFANWARNETENNNVRIVAFLDLHSYSQQVLYPYSYSCASAPPSLENLEELALGLAKAIRVSNGETYGVTSACEAKVPATSCGESDGPKAWPLIESGGGSALDWFYHELKVKYSFQIKLRDTGNYGFLLPAENIVPTGKEAFSAIRYMGEFLLSNRGIELEDDRGYGDSASSEDKVEKDIGTQWAGSRVSISQPSIDISEEREASVENDIQFELRRRRRK